MLLHGVPETIEVKTAAVRLHAEVAAMEIPRFDHPTAFSPLAVSTTTSPEFSRNVSIWRAASRVVSGLSPAP